MISRFFIDRPIFASVLSIVITLAGGVAVFSLPIAQYPQIVPPTIQVMCNYPGASAQVVAESVAAPIEQFVNGVEDMLYMSSNCTNDGSYSLSVTFKPGVKLNFAQVLVQNRVNLALPLLPDVVKQTGVTTRKRSPDILQVVSLSSPSGRYDQLYVSNYLTIYVQPEVARLDGVGDAYQFGPQDYSMRIWVDPERLAGMNLNADDVVNAIRSENQQVAAGQIGQQPALPGQQVQITLTTLGRLKEPEQFGDIVVKRTDAGRIVRIKDIGRVEVAPKNIDVTSELDAPNGDLIPCANMAVFQLSDANALDTADRVKAKMDELAKRFPAGLRYDIHFDTTPFIRESIDEVVRTLLLAIALVAIVVMLFLQSWRSALIPLVAVPVAIIGTFAVMAAIGFSLNNLTLFGLVLAIGIVVDDAIVVVECVEHHIEEGMLPRAAAIQAMREVSGPVIAVALVLTAVFMPCMFITGITGAFFRQFAVTISASTVISAFNSLTLSPALAAILLKPTTAKKDPVARALRFLFGWLIFEPFNRAFSRATSAYTRIVERALRGSAIVLVLYGGLLFLTQFWLRQLPSGYIPTQDKGYLFISVQLPDASAVERTRHVMHKIDDIVRHTPGVSHRLVLTGMSFTLGVIAPNAGNFFVILDEFHKRNTPQLYYEAIADRLTKEIGEKVPECVVRVLGPTPVQGLGNAGGWKIMIEDRGDLGLGALQQNTDRLVAVSKLKQVAPVASDAPADSAAKPPAASNPPASAKAAATPAAKPEENPILTKVFGIFTVKYPQLFVDVNRDQVHALGLTLGDVYDTLQVYLGSRYVNDFNLFGRTWQVIVQAEPQFRDRVSNVGRLRVRAPSGKTVPLGTLASVKEIAGPLVVTRYNLYPAAYIAGDTQPGVSSGQAILEMERLANATLPKNMAFEWTEITYLQVLAANTGMILFGLAVLLVFLVLAAQYESWSLPLAVILVVPMCLLSSTAGVAFAHYDVNVFTQIGFVVLVGLASKNAVLIVEFAKHKYEAGMSRHEATLEACRLRLRPILMTSFAFILGVVPLLTSTGAGKEMRHTLGNAVFSGMLGVTFFGIFLTPVFFNVIEWFGTSRLFSSPALERVNRFVLGVVSLGHVRRWVRSRGKRGTQVPSSAVSPQPLPSPSGSAVSDAVTVIDVTPPAPLVVAEPMEDGGAVLPHAAVGAKPSAAGPRASTTTNGDSLPANGSLQHPPTNGTPMHKAAHSAPQSNGEKTPAPGAPGNGKPSPPDEPLTDIA